jgi:sulfate permease, SulP family
MPQDPQQPVLSPGDLSGGFASAVVSITGNVAAGVIAFAPLGPEYAGQGIIAGMLSSIVAGLLSAMFGGAPGMISGPKATTSMAFAALLASLLATGRFDMATPEGADLLLSLAFGAVVLSGSVQVMLGASRVGRLVEFMPYPVVAGIRNTTAILLITGQFWTFVGVPRQSWGDLLGHLAQFQPATAVVAALTALVAWKGSRWMPKPAVPVAALIAGTLLYYAIQLAAPGVRLGPVLGALPSVIPRPDYFGPVLAALTDAGNLPVIAAVVSGAIAMAVLDSLSALITLVSYQSIADRRFDPNKQLVGQGIGSIASAFFGGLTTSGILARAAVNHSAGGRAKASGVVNAVAVLLLLVVLSGPLALIPKAAIAGLIMVIASGLFDRWSAGQMRESFRADAHDRRDNRLATVQMGFVVIVGVSVSLVAAVGTGIVLSVVSFVAQMTRSPIRRVRTGVTVRSARSRDPETTRILSESGHRIAVVELEGTIFFGTAEALATKAEGLSDEGTDFVIFDMKRVQGVDATGFKVLGQTFKRLRGRGTTLGFSYVMPGVLRSDIAEDLMLNGVPEARMWQSTDRALEYFEEGLLFKLGADDFDDLGWTVAAFGGEWGLDARQCETLESYVVERTFDGGEVLFEEGDTDCSMFLLGNGLADISVSIGENRRHRVGTASRGTVIGEISLLDGRPRSAAVEATGPLTVYELTAEAFDRMLENDPQLAVRVQAGLARILAERLRRASELMIELES